MKIEAGLSFFILQSDSEDPPSLPILPRTMTSMENGLKLPVGFRGGGKKKTFGMNGLVRDSLVRLRRSSSESSIICLFRLSSVTLTLFHKTLSNFLRQRTLLCTQEDVLVTPGSVGPPSLPPTWSASNCRGCFRAHVWVGDLSRCNPSNPGLSGQFHPPVLSGRDQYRVCPASIQGVRRQYRVPSCAWPLTATPPVQFHQEHCGEQVEAPYWSHTTTS